MISDYFSLSCFTSHNLNSFKTTNIHGQQTNTSIYFTECGVGEGWVVVLVSGQGRDWGTTRALARRRHEETILERKKKIDTQKENKKQK